jgi:hypothetical protein
VFYKKWVIGIIWYQYRSDVYEIYVVENLQSAAVLERLD